MHGFIRWLDKKSFPYCGRQFFHFSARLCGGSVERNSFAFDHYFYKVDYRGFCGCHKYALVAQLDRVSDDHVSGQFG